MKTVTLRVPDDLRTLIAEAAEANGQSQSDYMRQAIEIHVKRVNLKHDRQSAEKTPRSRRSRSSAQPWIVAMGLASIAPTAALSASEGSSESRLRLVRGLVISPPRTAVFRSCEKEYPNRRVVQLQALGLGCRPIRPARLPRCSPRVLNRAGVYGYRCRVFNPLDGHTARRVKPLHRPAGLTSPGGRNVSKYVAGLPVRASSLRRGAAGLSGRISQPESTPRSGWSTTHYMHS
ncbi:ribbon-helix-helix protein, CopG family [Corynebacterium macginleyi]|uniref:ribbon-helix-helix protein, CopG family n=1 Tax=Corynebacterium macginleyi TaxID=38290 RepID=UPI00190BD110|nr:ribbon-helix-helix protein, CopG family [Corynebacterium macginleyi]MBK4142143.1 ribbon-helix-helix protein, CopG family [Corynebacterium macginleyi]